MRRFPILYVTIRAFMSLIMWTLNKIFTVLYMCLPLWFFMLIMQLRDKNNKATAIGAFTDVNSEFQFIFPDYILVSNKPNNLKSNWKKEITNLNNFIDKWKWVIICSLLVVGILLVTIKIVF